MSLAALLLSLLPLEARIAASYTVASLAVGDVSRTWENLAPHSDIQVSVRDHFGEPIVANGSYDLSVSLDSDWFRISGDFHASLVDVFHGGRNTCNAEVSYHVQFHSDAPFAFTIAGTPENLGYAAGSARAQYSLYSYGTSSYVVCLYDHGGTTTGTLSAGSYEIWVRSSAWPFFDQATNVTGFSFSAANNDHITEAPTLVLPQQNQWTASPINVNFYLPEAALVGSVKLTFSDGATTRMLTLANSQSVMGSRAFTFDTANPTNSPAVASGPPIPDGNYTVTLNYQEPAGNPPASASSSNVKVAATPFSQWKHTTLGTLAPDLAEYALNLSPTTVSRFLRVKVTH